MKLTPYVLAVLALMTSRGAIAVEGEFYYSGNKILEFCSSSDPVSTTACHTYAVAVADTFELYIAALGGRKPGSTGICTPKGASHGQIGKVFTKYLEDHPEHLHQPAALLAANSLIEAFPCPKSE